MRVILPEARLPPQWAVLEGVHVGSSAAPQTGVSQTTALSSWAQTWIREALGAPTPVQEQAWPVLATGADAVLVAPTGSGKTLAAFLSAIDQLMHSPPAERGRILYVSPLKALAADIERNLRAPLVGMMQVAARDGVQVADVTIGVRTGDTPQSERSRQAKHPPDIWITTPESLFLLLTSRARSALQGITTVIIDEVHVLADTKRGAHLALSLERLDALLERPVQRIALSATVTPIGEITRYLRAGDPQSVAVIDPPIDKEIVVHVESPVEDFREIGTTRYNDDGSERVTGSAAGDADRMSVWPQVAARIVDIVTEHRSTIVFVNSRRLAERLTARINEEWQHRHGDDPGVAVTPLARAHHGSVAKDVRQAIEEELKDGRLRAVVATSSMELGVDMGAVDVVIQVQAPPSVASGLQRVGRAGHSVGRPSVGHVISTHPQDLLLARTVASGMHERDLEPLRVPTNPLDVLAQQIVAMCAMEEWRFDDLLALIRRTASFHSLSDTLLSAVLGMLAGSYPSDRFAELKPRVVWERDGNTITARPGAGRLAVTNAGTIPDRGLFGVHIATDGAPRVGELDEEMVYESRVGEVITLGASSWRIEEITHDRVLVSPAPATSGRMPFWRGDAIGRPAALAPAIGAAARAAHPDLPALQSYLDEQRIATGDLPDENTVIIEAFTDEIGDWRVVVHSPYGARVHAPWALVVRSVLADHLGIVPQVMHADDGLVIRLPDYVPEAGHDSTDVLLDLMATSLSIDPVDVETLVHREVTGSAVFAARFRECAARALLLPRRRPDRRTPLWQQRQRANSLLQVAADYPDFPVILETMRECVQDVYDLPALTDVLQGIKDGRIRLRSVVTDHPSPFARSLLFGYVANYLYEGDAPLAERRASALSIDTTLLADLLGTAELRSLLDLDAIEAVEAELAHRTDSTKARDREDAADLLRILGPLDDERARSSGIDPQWLDELIDARRAIRVHVAGRQVTATIEDAARLRDGLGVVLPPGIPQAHLEAVPEPLVDIITRFARTHGPFSAEQIIDEWALAPGSVAAILDRLVSSRTLLRGEFRPGGHGVEYCNAEVLHRIRRRTIARLREEIEPVDLHTYAAFLPHWHGIGGTPESMSTADVLDRLSALALPAQAVLSIVRVRVPSAQATDIDALLASGALTWWSLGPLGGKDMRVAWAPTSIAATVGAFVRGRSEASRDQLSDVERAVLDVLAGGGSFSTDAIHSAVVSGGVVVSVATLSSAMWDLARTGWITCDSWSYVHAMVHGRASAGRAAGPSPGRTGPARRLRMPRRTRIAAMTSGPRWRLAPGADSTAPTTAEGTAEFLGLLLERWAVITRAAVTAEDTVGGFAGLYPALSTMSDAGICQRVYAIEGAGGAQFALPGVVDEIRAFAPDARDEEIVVMPAVDPANPFGAIVPWPDTTMTPGALRPTRRAGALVAMRSGGFLAWLDPAGANLTTVGTANGADRSPMIDADDKVALLRRLAAARTALLDRPRSLLASIDGASVVGAPSGATSLGDWLQAARAAGFSDAPRGLRWPSNA
jgi:ATP-dependent Lhr-like helicase